MMDPVGRIVSGMTSHQRTVIYPIQLTLAANIRAIRARLDISQQDLAERSGCHQAHISHYEKGRVWPKPDRLEALAAALGTTPAKLLEDVAA